MPLVEQTILSSLQNVDGRVFEEGLRVLGPSLPQTAKSRAEAVIEVMRGLDRCSTIGARERDRRLQLVVERYASNPETLTAIAMAARTQSVATKNAIMARLPPNLRQSLYASETRLRETSKAASTEPAISDAVAQSPADNASDVGQPMRSEFQTVLLLGTESEHAGNPSLLRQHGFTWTRRESRDALKELANADICGIVVGGSWWKQLSPAEHGQALKDVCGLSSILWLRIDVDHLENTAARDLLTTVRAICCGDRSSSVFCSGSGCKLTMADIGSLTQVAELLAAAHTTRFHPAEISAPESILLRAAATKHVRVHNADGGIRLQVVETSFFSNGRSLAKIVLVRPDDGGAPFVIKLDSLANLQREMQQFRTYIDRWDGKTHPELHFHAGQGAILFSLIDAAGRPGIPAPTLDERLEKLLNSELGDWGEPPPNEENLVTALRRTAAKLAGLNRRKVAENASFFGYDWIVSTLDSLAAKKIVWHLNLGDGTSIDVLSIARAAGTRVAGMGQPATVHGDVHLNNVLLNDDREPYLIDYANSGSGHPCYDLVRLNASVLYRSFRMLADEADISRLLHEVYVRGSTYDSVAEAFPDVLAATGNRVAIKTLLAVRNHAIEVLRDFGGTIEDYLAMETLVACHALTMINPQAGVVRAAIKALIIPP